MLPFKSSSNLDFATRLVMHKGCAISNLALSRTHTHMLYTFIEITYLVCTHAHIFVGFNSIHTVSGSEHLEALKRHQTQEILQICPVGSDGCAEKKQSTTHSPKKMTNHYRPFSTITYQQPMVITYHYYYLPTIITYQQHTNNIQQPYLHTIIIDGQSTNHSQLVQVLMCEGYVWTEEVDYMRLGRRRRRGKVVVPSKGVGWITGVLTLLIFRNI